MVLQGQARQAVEAFFRRPPQMDVLLLAEMEGGCIANDVTVAMLQNIDNPSSAGFRQEVRDLCTDAGVAGLTNANMLQKWYDNMLSTAPVANASLPTFLAQTAAALTAGGAGTPAVSQAILDILSRQPAAGTTAGGTTDLSARRYVVMLHMGGLDLSLIHI